MSSLLGFSVLRSTELPATIEGVVEKRLLAGTQGRTVGRTLT